MAGIGNRARLGIPRVNPNPRVPLYKAALQNRAAVRRAPGIGPARPVARPQHPRVGPAKPVVPGAQSNPSDPFQTANAAAPSTAPQPAPATTPPAGGNNPFQIPAYTGSEDPRDAAYWAAVNKLVFNDQQEYAKNQREQAYNDANYNMALQQAIQTRALQERQLGLSSLSNGLAASGYHDRTDAEQTTAYTNNRAQAELNKNQQDQAIAAAQKALIEGFDIDNAALMAEAGARYAERKEREAEKGAPELGAEGSAAAGAGAKAGGKFAFYPTPGTLPMNQKGKGGGGGRRSAVGPARPVSRKPAVAKGKKAR